MKIVLSTLPHTWLIDIDGTIVRHNGHKNGGDELLPGVKKFWETIPAYDKIILLSARTEEEKAKTLEFIEASGLRYDMAIFGLPKGERILINDAKQSGLQTAISVCVPRDYGFDELKLELDEWR